MYHTKKMWMGGESGVEVGGGESVRKLSVLSLPFFCKPKTVLKDIKSADFKN